MGHREETQLSNREDGTDKEKAKQRQHNRRKSRFFSVFLEKTPVSFLLVVFAFPLLFRHPSHFLSPSLAHLKFHSPDYLFCFHIVPNEYMCPRLGDLIRIVVWLFLKICFNWYKITTHFQGESDNQCRSLTCNDQIRAVHPTFTSVNS